MQKIVVVGRAVNDPEKFQTTNGNGGCEFRFAAGGKYGQDKGTFYDVKVWGKRAEAISEYVRKGRQLTVLGDFKCREYESGGAVKYRLEIHADAVEFGDQKVPAPAGASPAYDEIDPFADE